MLLENKWTWEIKRVRRGSTQTIIPSSLLSISVGSRMCLCVMLRAWWSSLYSFSHVSSCSFFTRPKDNSYSCSSPSSRRKYTCFPAIVPLVSLSRKKNAATKGKTKHWWRLHSNHYYCLLTFLQLLPPLEQYEDNGSSSDRYIKLQAFLLIVFLIPKKLLYSCRERCVHMVQGDMEHLQKTNQQKW